MDINSTSFCKLDATHINNLGVKRPFLMEMRREAKRDPVVAYLLEHVEVLAGNTIQLPQKVNINPDRVIDRLHGALVDGMIAAIPVVSRNAVQQYYNEARAKMDDYRLTRVAKGQDGLATCAESYLTTYNRSPPPTLTREQKRARMTTTVTFQLLPQDHTYQSLVGYVFGTFEDLRKMLGVTSNDDLPLRFEHYPRAAEPGRPCDNRAPLTHDERTSALMQKQWRRPVP